MDIKIEPSGAALGAFVRDIDLNQPLTDALRQQILSAWQKHIVLIFDIACLQRWQGQI